MGLCVRLVLSQNKAYIGQVGLYLKKTTLLNPDRTWVCQELYFWSDTCRWALLVYCRLSSDIFWTMADAYHLFGWIPRLLQDVRYVVGQARRALLGLSDSQPGLNSASHYCETQQWHSVLQCKVAAVRQFGGRHRPLPVLKERPDRLQPCCKKSSPSVKARTIPNSFPIKI